MAGRHDRMRGEHRARGDCFERAFERQAACGQHADAFEHEERRMAFIHVPHRWREIQRSECAYAADAEHDLLLDAGLPIAAVQPIRDRAIGVGVFPNVRVEQIEHHVANARLPHAQRYFTSGQRNADAELLSAVRVHELDGQLGEVGIGIRDVLAALGIDRLLKITLPIQQADADERNAHVARGLAAVAREDAESARVDRQAFVEAELRAEIRNQVAFRQTGLRDARRALAVVRVVRRQDAIEIVEEHRIIGRRAQTRIIDAT